MALRTKDNIERETKTEIPPPGFCERVSLRVKNPIFKLSGNDNPMIQLECEVFDPVEVKGPDGNMYDLTSLKPFVWIMLSGKNLQYVLDELLPRLGMEQAIDDEKPDLEPWKGLCFDAIMRVTERVKTKKDADSGGFVPLTDSFGKPVTDRRLEINVREILGKVDGPQDKPY